MHTESALTTPRVVRRTPFGNGAHHERKGNWRKLGRMTCCRGKRLRFEEMDERGQPSSHSCCAEEAVRCQRLTRAQTTWHLEVDAVNSLHKAQLRHARGEGEENIVLARMRASVNFTKKPSPLHTKLTSLSESTNCKPNRVNITLQNLHPTSVFLKRGCANGLIFSSLFI